MLDILLKEQKKRQEFKDKILGALSLHYNFVDKDTVVSRESATAGNLYSYLSSVLQIKNSTKFQQQTKSLLVSENLIRPVSAFGRVWFKGLQAKDATADHQIARSVIEQHYKDRDAYRQRQRTHASRTRVGRDEKGRFVSNH